MKKIVILIFTMSCAHHQATRESTHDKTCAFAGIARDSLPQLSRHEFNRLAALENVNLYWQKPEMKPDSFLVLGTHASAQEELSKYIQNKQFTSKLAIKT